MKKFSTNDLVNIEMEKFFDYWIAQPGQKGVKLDWDATWRNWVRNAKNPIPLNLTPQNTRPRKQFRMQDEEL